MTLLIYIILGIILLVGLVIVADKFLPKSAKSIIAILALLLSVFFGYKIYDSVMAPITFNKTKQERFRKVVDNMKDIRDAQVAHRTINGTYAKNFDDLESFIDTAKFVITQKRDSSYMEYDKVYRIDRLKEVVIIDTLGFRNVKDSLFKESDRYKTMKFFPYASNDKQQFELKTGIKDVNGYSAPVFELKVKKDVILHDQPEDMRKVENELVSVDEINGSEIIVGSLTKVSENGNWPTIYEGKKK